MGGCEVAALAVMEPTVKYHPFLSPTRRRARSPQAPRPRRAASSCSRAGAVCNCARAAFTSPQRRCRKPLSRKRTRNNQPRQGQQKVAHGASRGNNINAITKAPSGAKDIQPRISFAPDGASSVYLPLDPTACAVGYKYFAPDGASAHGILLC